MFTNAERSDAADASKAALPEEGNAGGVEVAGCGAATVAEEVATGADSVGAGVGAGATEARGGDFVAVALLPVSPELVVAAVLPPAACSAGFGTTESAGSDAVEVATTGCDSEEKCPTQSTPPPTKSASATPR